MTTPRSWIQSALALASFALLLLVSDWTGGARAASKVTIFTGTAVHFCPLYVADAKGYFKAEGLEVTVTMFTSGAAALEAFRAGNGNLILAGHVPSLLLWGRGEGVGIAPISPSYENAVVVAKREIRGVADLRGKKVATFTGATAELMLHKYLESGGLALKDITFINLAPPEQIIALDRGDIDAFVWDGLSGSKARDVSGDRVHVLATNRNFFADWSVLSADRAWAQANRDSVVAVLRAIQRANKFIAEQPEDAKATVARYAKMQPQLVQQIFPIYEFDLTYSKRFRKDTDDMTAFLIGKKTLVKPVDWTQQFDDSYPKAVAPALVQ
jgi:ABC-type nitrate/sulfonate/bicarbonate transport system substrate-binding protein